MLRILCIVSYYLQTVTVLLFLFRFIFLLFLFLLWFLLLKLPKLCWIIVVRVGHLVFLILVEMVSVFLHWERCWLWVCHMWPLLCWGKFALPAYWRVFIINGCWILSKAFSASIEIIMWFLSFGMLIWCITLIDLHILKNPCIPGINPTWSWCMILLMCCWVCFLVSCWEFLHLCSLEMLACSFIFSDIFVWFWYQCDGCLVEWVWECSSLCYVLKEFEKDRC